MSSGRGGMSMSSLENYIMYGAIVHGGRISANDLRFQASYASDQAFYRGYQNISVTTSTVNLDTVCSWKRTPRIPTGEPWRKW